MIYTVSVLIMIRSIYRVIGFVEGQEGYLMTHEWTLYICDANIEICGDPPVWVDQFNQSSYELINY